MRMTEILAQCRSDDPTRLLVDDDTRAHVECRLLEVARRKGIRVTIGDTCPWGNSLWNITRDARGRHQIRGVERYYTSKNVFLYNLALAIAECRLEWDVNKGLRWRQTAQCHRLAGRLLLFLSRNQPPKLERRRADRRSANRAGNVIPFPVRSCFGKAQVDGSL